MAFCDTTQAATQMGRGLFAVSDSARVKETYKRTKKWDVIPLSLPPHVRLTHSDISPHNAEWLTSLVIARFMKSLIVVPVAAAIPAIRL